MAPTPKPHPDDATIVDRIDRIEKRTSNIEQVVLEIQAVMTPRWLRMVSWGAFAGACLKALFD